MDRISPFSAMLLQFKLAWVNLSHQYFCWVFLSPNNFLVRPHRSLRPTYINQLVNFPIAGNWHKLLHLHMRMFLSYDVLEHNDGP